ncbi:MAG: hypothetical protein AB7S54_08030 [Bacteroidales bacterium]
MPKRKGGRLKEVGGVSRKYRGNREWARVHYLAAEMITDCLLHQ